MVFGKPASAGTSWSTLRTQDLVVQLFEIVTRSGPPSTASGRPALDSPSTNSTYIIAAMHFSGASAIVLSATLLAGGYLGLAQAPPEAEKKDPKFAEAAEEVSLDLIVRDKHGRPVRDLKPEEIRVSDDGQPMTIRSLQLSGNGQGVTIDTVTKAPGASASDPLKQMHLVTMLFETLDANASKLAREGAYELLKGLTSVNTYMSVLRVGGRVGVMQGFTADREALKRAVDRVTNPGKVSQASDTQAMESQLRQIGSSTSQADQLSGGDVSSLRDIGRGETVIAYSMALILLDAIDTSARMTRDQHQRPSVSSLLGVVRTMAKLPGRKVIVYFSQGLPLSEGVVDQFRKMIGEANRAGVSVYTVDASGVDPEAKINTNDVFAQPVGNGLDQGRSSPSTSLGELRRQSQAGDRISDAMHSNTQAALRDLAADTGGAFIGGTNDLRKSIHQLVEDEGTYYLASYSPHISQYDGHFRRVSVAIARPGVKVQTRSGYYELPPSATPVQTFEMPLLKALSEKTGQEDPRLRLRAFEFARAEAAVNGEIVMEVPLADMQPKEVAHEKAFQLHFSVLALIRDSAGNIAAQFSQDIPYQGASEMKEKALAGTFTFERPFKVRPGNYRMEAAVLDQFSERITVAHSEFDFSGTAQKSFLSEPALVGSLDPQPTSVDPDDFMQYQGKKVMPRLTSMVRNDGDRDLPIFFVVYPDDAEAAKPALTLQMLRDGEQVGNAPMALPQSATTVPIPFIASIAVRDLDPGNYVLRAMFSQGPLNGTREVAFVVQGEQRMLPPAASSPAGKRLEDPEPKVEAIELAPGQQLVFQHRPGSDDLNTSDGARILAGARERALGYAASLPSFTCHENTHREVSKIAKTGPANWTSRDAFTELVRFVDGSEERRVVERNGQKVDLDRSSLAGLMMNGEFGHLLTAVFDQRAQAEFVWKESAFVGVERYEVFSYKVDRAHSFYKLRDKDGNYAIHAAYVGEVYLDTQTFDVRRIVLRAVEIPKECPIRASSLALDYDRVSIGQSDHLVPVNGVIEIRERRVFERNLVQFRDYRRFGSETTIRFIP
jgi:VWFA-related protein